jgi:hypothetical protein
MADEAQKLSRNAHTTSFICISTPLLPHPLLNPSQHKHAFFLSTWVSGLVQLPSLTERAWDGTVHYIYTGNHCGLVGTEETIRAERSLPSIGWIMSRQAQQGSPSATLILPPRRPPNMFLPMRLQEDPARPQKSEFFLHPTSYLLYLPR